MKNNLVALGCSLTKDNYIKTWPDYLASMLDMNCVNLGARGAGLDFVSKRLISYCLNKTDFVTIMLPSADRFDWYIDNNSPLQEEALQTASWQNGRFPELLTIDGETSLESGYCLSGGEHRGYKKYWFKYFYSETKALLDYWSTVLFLQKYLESENVCYVFTSAYDKDNLIEQPYNKANAIHQMVNNITSKIDFSKFVYYNNDEGFLNFANQHGFEYFDKNHPNTKSHQHFAEYVFQQVNNKYKFDK